MPGSAPTPEKDAASQEATQSGPEFPFDDEQHDLVLDLAGLCAIPFNSESTAIESLRALQFEKGKALHGPEPGTYCVGGTHTTVASLSLVHFRTSTARKPELLLSLADYGMVSTGATGVFVCSLPLPLLKRKNTYETSVRYTKIADVSGFSSIDHGKAPWSMHLKPTLQKLGAVHCKFNMFNSKEVEEYMKQPLQGRIEELHKLARESLTLHLEGIRRQDKFLAEKQGAAFESQLQSSVDFLLKQPPSSYDKPLSERIVVLRAGEEAPQPWVTPSKASSVLAGEARDRLERTTKCKRTLRSETAAAAADMSPTHVPQQPQEEGQAPPPPANDAPVGDSTEKRARKAPEHFEPPKPAAANRMGKKLVAQKAKEGDTINPRTGKPYARGPYNMDRSKSPASQLASEVGVLSSKPVQSQTTSLAEKEMVTKLKARVTELEVEVMMLKGSLSKEKERGELMLSNAVLQMRTEMQMEVMNKYRTGLLEGHAMAKGLPISDSSVGMASPACSGGTGSSSLSRFVDM